MTSTAKRAMELSAQQNRIVTIDGDADSHRALRDACDDYETAFGCTEYWGRDQDGDEWRVHVLGDQRAMTTKCIAMWDDASDPSNPGWVFRFNGEHDEIAPNYHELTRESTEADLRYAAEDCADYARLGTITEFEISR